MAEPRSAAQEARDPSTSPERLVELTEKHPQLQKLIVLNPSCPEVARQWILATNPWAKQAYEASCAAEPEAPEDGPEPDAAEPDEASVWGDLGLSSAAATDTAPQEVPKQTPARSVRIAPDAAVVPLGAASPVSPAPVSPASAPPAAAGAGGAGYGDGAAAAPAAGGAAAWAPEGESDDGSRTRRRTWYACGGCLLLALLLIVLIALVGRAWLGGDEDEYQRDSSTTAAEESPSEQPTEEPTEERTTTPDPVSPAPEGAQEMTTLRSPTGNISCSLEKDSVACSVEERDYEDNGQEDCSEGPFSIQVTGGETSAACGTTFGGESAETLEYGESATNGTMACTSRSEGMTCWDTITGKGFMVNRSEYDTF